LLSSGAREYYQNVLADGHVAAWIRDAELELEPESQALA